MSPKLKPHPHPKTPIVSVPAGILLEDWGNRNTTGKVIKPSTLRMQLAQEYWKLRLPGQPVQPGAQKIEGRWRFHPAAVLEFPPARPWGSVNRAKKVKKMGYPRQSRKVGKRNTDKTN